MSRRSSVKMLPAQLFVMILTGGISSLHASTVLDGYNGAIKGASTIEPISEEDFGQSVSLLDGTFELSAIDVSAPTNSGLITFGRRLKVSQIQFDEFGIGADYTTSPLGAFWDMDVPHMRGIFAAAYGGGWASAHPGLRESRCSHLGAPSIYGVGNFYQVNYDPSSYSSGVSVSVPGMGEQSVKRRLVGSGIYPSDGPNYVATTRDNWKFSCLTSLKKGGGEGFRMLTPDGKTYLFDWLVTRQTSNINDTTCHTGQVNFYRSAGSAERAFNFCATGVAVPRSEAFLFATEVLDRFGNRTEYGFDPINPQRLLTIRHNNELLMSFQYLGHQIHKVISFGREWTYNYSAGMPTLTSVTLPDQSKWQYLSSGLVDVNRFEPQALWAGCVLTIGSKTTAVPPSAADTASISVTAPAGATAVFELRRIVHGTRQGESGCFYTFTGSSLMGPIVHNPSAYQAASLYRMTVAGPGLENFQRTYQYAPGFTSPFIATTTTSDMGGRSKKYLFDTDAIKVYGRLMEEQVLDGGALVSRVVYTHLMNSAGQNFPDKVGIPVVSNGWGSNADNLNRPLIEREVHEDGRVFRWQVPAVCEGNYCFDAFARPTKVVRSSAPQ